jgi:hypothetical protein
MSQPDPVPRDFGWRYIAWLAWTNAVTILMVIQGVFATLALASDMFSHNTVRVYMVASAVLSAVVAQIKRNAPPPPPPTKDLAK